VIVAAGALSAEAAQKAPARNLPTTITSGSMEYDANGQTVVFIGKVHVKRTDFELWADKMTVYLDKSGRPVASGENSPTGGMEAGDIDRIVAEKNVRMTSNDKEGTCNKVTYYAKEDKFVMEGSPVLRDQKKSTITGGTVVHYLSANRSQVLDGGGVTFYAPDRTERLTPDFSGKGQ
jgi:lipopolysaccharide export system protein LptA